MDIPIVPMKGYEAWRDSYEWGGELSRRFPFQAAEDFTTAICYNGHPFGEDFPAIRNLEMEKEGERDGGEWIWKVELEDGQTWTATGWCDYTGWDCQSALNWERKV